MKKVVLIIIGTFYVGLNVESKETVETAGLQQKCDKLYLLDGAKEVPAVIIWCYV